MGFKSSTWNFSKIVFGHDASGVSVSRFGSGKSALCERVNDGNPDKRCGVVDVFQVDAGYDQRATPVVREQLAKAGVRLAAILRAAFQ
jgi:hypothetical protein